MLTLLLLIYYIYTIYRFTNLPKIIYMYKSVYIWSAIVVHRFERNPRPPQYGTETVCEIVAKYERFVKKRKINFYRLSGGGYEVYDPYTGNVSVLMGPPPYQPGPGHPMLTAMYQPIPLQPVDWYGPGNEHWMSAAYQPNGSRHHHRKSVVAAAVDAQQVRSILTYFTPLVFDI